jgi:hypothetical protein
MQRVLGITQLFCEALQREEQDIVNALVLLDSMYIEFQRLRNDGWLGFLDDVQRFCLAHEVEVPDMSHAPRGRSRARDCPTNDSLFRVNIFLNVIDSQVKSIRDRFSDSRLELLQACACFDPGTIVPA